MEFIDEAKIYVQAGDGGSGCVSFRREKYVPKGGPDGGNGGKGGDVCFKVNPNLSTLIDFKYQQHYHAQSGRPGGGKQMTGRSGDDLIVEVPLGTLLRNQKTNELLKDLNQPQEQFVVAKGGKGGRGNHSYKSSTNQAPRNMEKGFPGEEITLQLELKLLADIAMVGFPNAGKSTLLSVITSAHPKIADYPFTTLTPQLGVVSPNQGSHFVVADIPGIIEGAHEGKGLGLRFLKHLERSKVLWFVLELFSKDQKEKRELKKTYLTLWHELRAYKEELQKRPHMVILNKADLNPDEREMKKFIEFLQQKGTPCFVISAKTKLGLKELLWQSHKELQFQIQKDTFSGGNP